MFNKIDLIKQEPGVRRDQYGRISDVYASAETKDGLGLLKKAISEQKLFRESREHLRGKSTKTGFAGEEKDNLLEENYSPKRESLT